MVAKQTFKATLFGTGFMLLLFSLQQLMANPTSSSASLTITLIAPALVGILVGARTGAVVGILGGTLGTLFFGVNNQSIIVTSMIVFAYALTGAAAGWIKSKTITLIGSLSIIVGSLLIWFGLLITQTNTLHEGFWFAWAVEMLILIVSTNILAMINHEIMQMEEWNT